MSKLALCIIRPQGIKLLYRALLTIFPLYDIKL
uniref:Uncharacterized protein n=1 Tax=Rhizophora mucronata TaxID=61149 RepID=A0A2P2QGW4_RHIMU